MSPGEIKKGKPVRVFEEEEPAWKTVEPGEMLTVAKALADPLRLWVYQELEKGPVRQVDLARRASESFNRVITDTLLRYHLQHLARAGLVRFEEEPGVPKKARIIRRVSEVRIQLRPFTSEVPRDELVTWLREVFRSGKE